MIAKGGSDMTTTARHSGGFSLIEAILTITIGAVLLASGTVMYQQYRQSAGDSSAVDRVMALQATVESSYAALNQYPSLASLQAAWQGKRPLDANLSPWGGYAASAGVAITSGAAISGGPDTGSNGTQVPNPLVGDSGILYYWTKNNTSAYVDAVDTAGGGSSVVGFHNYLVAIVPNHQPGIPGYEFVRGGHADPGNLSGGASGIVGPGGPPPSF